MENKNLIKLIKNHYKKNMMKYIVLKQQKLHYIIQKNMVLIVEINQHITMRQMHLNIHLHLP